MTMIAFLARRNSLSLPAALVLVSGLACGSSRLQAGPWKQPAWKVPEAQYDVVSSVDPADKTVDLHHVGGTIKVDHTLKIDAFSEILVDGKKASLADLKPGIRVNFSLGGDGTTRGRLTTIDAPTPPPTATPSFSSHGR